MRVLICILVSSLISSSSFSQEKTENQPSKKAPTSTPTPVPPPQPAPQPGMYQQLDNQAPTKNESWYTQWGLGLAAIKYDPDITSSLSSWTRTQVAVELLGFYWPMPGHHTMHGFVITGQGDSYKSPSGLTEYSISQSLYSYSIQHFFGANIGHEWFVRGDVGLAKAVESISGSGTTISGVSDTGFGFNLGGGYGWATNYDTRFLLTGLLTHKKIRGTSQDINLGSFSVLASFLF